MSLVLRVEYEARSREGEELRSSQEREAEDRGRVKGEERQGEGREENAGQKGERRGRERERRRYSDVIAGYKGCGW